MKAQIFKSTQIVLQNLKGLACDIIIATLFCCFSYSSEELRQTQGGNSLVAVTKQGCLLVKACGCGVHTPLALLIVA